MNIHTKNELKDYLDKDMAWRKRELTSILSNVKMSENKSSHLAIRTAILLLYAHWEGSVKYACSIYLNYVSNQGLVLNKLNDSFFAVALKQRLKSFEETNKSTYHVDFIRFLRNGLSGDAKIDDKHVISSKSNLNSIILEQMLVAVGLSYSKFSTKASIIDEKLLNYRNTIAHGEYLRLTKSDYVLIHGEITSIMNQIKNDIENEVALGNYSIA